MKLSKNFFGLKNFATNYHIIIVLKIGPDQVGSAEKRGNRRKTGLVRLIKPPIKNPAQNPLNWPIFGRGNYINSGI